MRRDIVCRLRLIVDSFPPIVRNSRLLFEIARVLFKLPKSLFYFRSNYDCGNINDFYIYYDLYNKYSLNRISESMDINSYHWKYIQEIMSKLKPLSFLDVGCGSGYVIRNLAKKYKNTKFIGIDFTNPSTSDNNIELRSGDILPNLSDIQDKSIDFVLCAHVLEHLNNPDKVVWHLRRITRKVDNYVLLKNINGE